MRTRILTLIGVAVVGYVAGTRSNRPVARESVRHQLVRMASERASGRGRRR